MHKRNAQILQKYYFPVIIPTPFLAPLQSPDDSDHMSSKNIADKLTEIKNRY